MSAPGRDTPPSPRAKPARKPLERAEYTPAGKRVRVWLLWYGEQQEPCARVVGVAGGGGWGSPRTRYTLTDWSGGERARVETRMRAELVGEALRPWFCCGVDLGGLLWAPTGIVEEAGPVKCWRVL